MFNFASYALTKAVVSLLISLSEVAKLAVCFLFLARDRVSLLDSGWRVFITLLDQGHATTSTVALLKGDLGFACVPHGFFEQDRGGSARDHCERASL